MKLILTPCADRRAINCILEDDHSVVLNNIFETQYMVMITNIILANKFDLTEICLGDIIVKYGVPLKYIWAYCASIVEGKPLPNLFKDQIKRWL